MEGRGAYFSTVFLKKQILGGRYGGGAGVTPDKEVTTGDALTRVYTQELWKQCHKERTHQTN